jgi:hypothetical protein
MLWAVACAGNRAGEGKMNSDGLVVEGAVARKGSHRLQDGRMLWAVACAGHRAGEGKMKGDGSAVEGGVRVRQMKAAGAVAKGAPHVAYAHRLHAVPDGNHAGEASHFSSIRRPPRQSSRLQRHGATCIPRVRRAARGIGSRSASPAQRSAGAVPSQEHQCEGGLRDSSPASLWQASMPSRSALPRRFPGRGVGRRPCRGSG